MTDSKYSLLLSMAIFDWQELIGPIKSVCLDNVLFGYLISGCDCGARAAWFFPERREGERNGKICAKAQSSSLQL